MGVGNAVRMAGAMALFGIAAPAVAADPAAASTDAILAAARSCSAATSSVGVDPHRLEADGWSKGSISDHGKSVSSDLVFYGKGGIMVMYDTRSDNPVCIVVARLSSTKQFPEVQVAMQAAYGAPAKDDGKGKQLFIAPDHRVVDLESTGSNTEPSVRVAVGPQFQEK